MLGQQYCLHSLVDKFLVLYIIFCSCLSSSFLVIFVNFSFSLSSFYFSLFMYSLYIIVFISECSTLWQLWSLCFKKYVYVEWPKGLFLGSCFLGTNHYNTWVPWFSLACSRILEADFGYSRVSTSCYCISKWKWWD